MMGDADPGTQISNGEHSGDLIVHDTTTDSGLVRTLRLNRPRQRNALTTQLMRDLIEQLQLAAEDTSVKAVVLAAEGDFFCAGGDIKEFAGMPEGSALMHTRASLLSDLLGQIPVLPVPVVCAVQGGAIGAGGAVALACDAMVVTGDAYLAFPEYSNSVVPAVVAPAVVKHFGRRVAFDLLVSGRRMGVAEMVRRDVALSTTSSDLWASTMEYAARGALPPRIVVQATKQLIWRAFDGLDFDSALTAGVEVTRATWVPPGN